MDTVSSVTTKGVQYQIEDEVAREEKLNKKDLPSKLSFFQNDVGFIDKTVGNLINYYKKAETYSREELNELLSKKIVFKVVQELPTEDISSSTIYFVPRPRTEQEQDDYYNEYIYADAKWELIGNTFVDLSDYYLKEQTDEQIDLKLAAEKAERVEAERALQANIDEVQTNVDSVNAALDNERLRREQVDLLHSQSISALETNLGVETNRAENAESALSDRAEAAESHIADKDNPHNVTKEQIGLGNVANVETDSAPTYGSENNVSSGGVFNALETKVDKIEGKGLSDQNFTYGEKTKLAGLSNYDDTALNSRVTETETAIRTLNGDSSTEGSVSKKIADAIGKITELDFVVVAELPATGRKGTVYFVRGEGSKTKQQYNEYVWLDSAWEQLGKSVVEIDLSNVYSKAEVNALVSAKQDKITISDNSATLSDSDNFLSGTAGTNPVNMKKTTLSKLWTYISAKISSTNQAVNGITFEIV